MSVIHAREAKVVCASCHPRETAAFLASSMGRSIGTPVPTVPAGKVIHAGSGSVLQITWTNGRMKHHLTELGLRADYQIDYQIGAGKVGSSYIARVGDFLVQSPASYYRRYGWDVSPGFKASAVLDFDRVLGSGCLFCHANKVQFEGKRRLAANAQIEPIGCERCHGDAQSHVLHPSRTNIVNPARLPAPARDNVCEQCHLEGVARLLNPGKDWSDIHPGQPLATALSIYVENVSVENVSSRKAVSQVEQLAASRCARESGGKLWCGTCHDPHGPKSVNRVAEVRAICRSCHPALTPAAHPNAATDCVGCHMARLTPTDVAHAASTDHRLLAKPAGSAPATAFPLSIRAWTEPAPDIRQRNLGLAELEAAAHPDLQTLAGEGAHLLESLPAELQQNDPAVLAALADLYLNRGNPDASVSSFRHALQLVPSNADYALYLGIALKARGDTDEAARALQNAIMLDPSLQRACLELSALYAKQRKPDQAAEVLQQSLRWNPQSVLIRSALDGLR